MERIIMYKLILTSDERDAITQVGYDYVHGSDLACILWNNCSRSPKSRDWDGDGDIEFTIPKHEAWKLKVGLPQDHYALLSNEFATKLQAFLDTII